MPSFRRSRFNDDVVVVTRRRVKPKSVPTKKVKVKAPLAKKKSSKSDQDIKAKVKPPSPPVKEKPVKQRKSIQAKRGRIDPEIYSTIICRVKELLPEPPFKIGISNEIFERLVGSFGVSDVKLRWAIGGYIRFVTSGKRYLKIAEKASHRHGFDGVKTEMTEEHRKSAAVRLEYIRTKIKKRKSSVRKSKSNGRRKGCRNE